MQQTANSLPDQSSASNTVSRKLSLFEFSLKPKFQVFAAAVAGGLLALSYIFHLTIPTEAAPHSGATDPAALLVGFLTFTSLAIGLYYGLIAAFESLKRRQFDIDVLMVIGAVMAAWIGAPAEGALLLFLFTLSGGLEDLAMARTRNAIEAINKLMPTNARLLAPDGSVQLVEPGELVIGQTIRILTGDLIPTDASITVGQSAINQAALTGESMPREVGPGDELMAGTLNTANPLTAVVLRPAAQSSLQRVLRLVTEAQAQREPVQRLIDRLSQPYSIAVIAVAIAAFLVCHFAWSIGFKDALYTAITLLIVASPCALIIATPTATLAAISRATRGGVLFKGGQSIDRLAGMQAIAFDKTGTLTVGRPVLIKVHSVGWSNEETLLAVAGSLESHSTHPIAEAIFAAAVERKLTLPELVDVRYVTGRGIEGTLAGKPARLGSLVFVESLIPECLRQRVNDVLVTVQSKGHIAVCMAHDDMAAVLILSDRVRAGAAELVGQLHALGIKPVVMLTGDNQRTADTVASQLGLDAFFAQLMPGDKVEHVKRLKSGDPGVGRETPGEFGEIGKLGERRKVGVIGDGVNDAPALAAADVAIAIGSIGSDAAMESADIVLLNDDLRAVPWAISLARRTRRTIIINLVFALSAIAVMTVAVLIGRANGYTVPLWMGVVGHEGGTLLVVAHSLWLLRFGQLKLEGATHQPGLPSGTHPPGSAEIRQAHAASAERRDLDVSLSPG